LKQFQRNDHHIETTCRAQHMGRFLEGQGHSMTLQQNLFWPKTLLFEVRFRKYFTEMITILRLRVARKLGSLPWRSRSQHDLLAKSCQAHNFVIWSQILELFYIIDHHIDTTCRAQYLGRYLEGQGHSMTFQQNCLRPITLLFEIDLKTISHEWSPYWDDVSIATFRLLPWRLRSQQDLTAKSCPAHNFVIWSQILQQFYINDHHIETMCRALHLDRFLKVNVTAWPFSIIVSGP